MGTLRYCQRTTSTLKHYGALWISMHDHTFNRRILCPVFCVLKANHER